MLFIEGVTPKIVPGGHQVIIVPRGILGDEHLLGAEQGQRIVRHLLGWYEEVQLSCASRMGSMSASSRSSSWPATSAASMPHPTKEAIDAITGSGR